MLVLLMMIDPGLKMIRVEKESLIKRIMVMLNHEVLKIKDMIRRKDQLAMPGLT